MKLKTLLGYASGTAVGALLSFMTLPALAWGFSQEDVGKIVMLQIACSLIAVIFSLGLDQSYVREFNEVDNKAALAKTCLLPGFCLLVVFCLLAIIFQQPLSLLLLGTSDSYFFAIAVFSFFVLYFERFFSVFIRMQEWALAYAVTKILPKAFFLTFVVSTYFYTQLQPFNILIVMQAFSWLLAVIVMATYLRKVLKSALQAKIAASNLKPLLHFGLPLVINGVAFWGLTYVDRLMLAHYASFAEVGLYALAAGFAGIAMLFQQIFATVWHPTIYRWVAEGVQLSRVNIISNALQLFSFVLIALVGCFSWLIPYVLPTEYFAIEFIIVACIIQPLFIMISEVSGIGISVARSTKFLPVITLISLLLNVALNIWLIPQFGAAGAAVSTAIATGVYLLLKTELSVRLWQVLPRFRLYLCGFIALSGSVLHGLANTQFSLYFVLMWLVLAVLVVWAYREVVPQLRIIKRGVC
ncbi:hypothetical protein WG68_03370 [Arsukibacterium ikkense]|uniref:Uncharacterized protein n=1 Tax=Arsukibacterium ikkense TaxID=336831 RepID=A0A0M2VCY9_9GAMM|nr:oligosaccharide flippase family protein [Arsukibacterium ikkense]KKO46983.1 hypothetical protein WG68_03370 [Arsukibacterium ikkense]